MKILADENIDYPVVIKLRESGFEVLSIMDMYQGETDNFVLSVANQLDCILLTNDKDFGDLVIRHKLPHKVNPCPSLLRLNFLFLLPIQPLSPQKASLIRTL